MSLISTKKLSFRMLVLFLCISVITASLIGCNAGGVTEGQRVTLEQLLTDPDKYNGTEVTVEGFYFHGFETIVLAERLEYSGYTEGHLVPKGRMVWVEGAIPLEIYNGLCQQEMMGPTERYGKLVIEGRFEYGDKYGHLGGFNAQIVPAEVQVSPWSP